MDGIDAAPETSLELEVMVRGVFDRQRFLDLLHHFILFEDDPDRGTTNKIIAGYHQFHAVNAAVEETVRASGMNDLPTVSENQDAGKFWSGKMQGGKPGDRRAGVVWQPHIRNKDKRRKLANRFKDSRDPFRIVIVRDMWLTGFDAPCLHTMYADKPMQGHGLNWDKWTTGKPS